MKIYEANVVISIVDRFFKVVNGRELGELVWLVCWLEYVDLNVFMGCVLFTFNGRYLSSCV